MYFNVIFGDLLAAILAPIIEAIAALFLGIFSFLAELLAPLFAALFAPVLELLFLIYATIALVFGQLVWGLIGLLGLTHRARGLSQLFYTMSALCLFYVVLGAGSFLVLHYQDQLAHFYSVQSIGIALFATLACFALGSALSEQPGTHKAKQETSQQTAEAAVSRPIQSPRQTGRAAFGKWGLVVLVIFLGCGTLLLFTRPAPEPTLRICTPTETAKILATRMLNRDAPRAEREAAHCQLL
ncbi:hypothetical protein TRM7557_02922 [Tritonibacter multivorans]|uniref:Uncharacterized protein n=1 Tax=Tritonibacter multivorans TaxID=928856 RepID=A0A0P1GWD1_9RHOB|nr:hypothetical protein [Tritonibacter multivorans]MDA7420939.1 hypothetical protein [Tritonibacter multivorans]CUH80488.1 hypothetical protein TRM7557_02922 [Tritonibacter multivorans]SFC81204.1 hypothetical protein SAMN04488049_104205 [Tritonibacter multivorans]